MKIRWKIDDGKRCDIDDVDDANMIYGYDVDMI